MTGRLGEAESRPLISEALKLQDVMAKAAGAAERRRAIIAELHAGGWTVRAIAAELGVSHSAVGQAIKNRAAD